jgi:hypothetical protein
MVDVNMAITRSKVTKEKVFKDKELIRKKSIVDWEEDQRLQQTFINTIKEM